MIKKIAKIIVLILLSLHSIGCDSVGSKYLIGERIQDDLSEQFNGVWSCDDGVVYAHYLNNGELRTAFVDWEQDNFKLEEIPVVLTKCGTKTFINFPGTQELGKTGSGYLFLYYYFISSDSFAICMPEATLFEKAIDKKRIKGQIKKEKTINNKISTSIYLEEPSDSICAFIENNDISKLFDLENPGIYKRIKKSKKSLTNHP